MNGITNLFAKSLQKNQHEVYKSYLTYRLQG